MDVNAPPPSPVGHGDKLTKFPSVTNELECFLHRSISVPDLNLPKRHSFPPEVTEESPPIVDFNDLGRATDAARTIGCFQLLNHGIDPKALRSARTAAAGMFKLAPEKKETMRTSEERRTGFEEAEEEVFWWCRRDDDVHRFEPEFTDFRRNVEPLWSEMERISRAITKALQQTVLTSNNASGKHTAGGGGGGGEGKDESVLCLYRGGESSVDSLQNDALRMLVRSSMCSYALCVHICGGEFAGWFQVYSRRGWISFRPEEGAVVVTIGSQLQRWSGGAFKQVVGKPVYKRKISDRGGGEEVEEDEFLSSMGFVYCHSTAAASGGDGGSGGGNRDRTSSSFKCQAGGDEKTITVVQQLRFVMWVVVLYHVWLYLRSLLS